MSRCPCSVCRRAREQAAWHCGVLVRWGSAWIGAHWSRENRRLCVNLVPFVTIWITPPGGRVP
jgi:hypothetical protein